MSPPAKTNPGKRLRRQYVLALSTVALLAVLSQIVVQSALMRQSSDAAVLSAAGRQRMLTERIARLCLAVRSAAQASDHGALDGHRAELRTALQQWQASHDGLRYGHEFKGYGGVSSRELVGAFERLEPVQREILESSMDLLRVIGGAGPAAIYAASSPEAADLSAVVQANIREYLPQMEIIAAGLAQEARERQAGLRKTEVVLLGIMLLVLLMEALCIFGPAARIVGYRISDAEARSRRAEHSTRLKDLYLANMSHELRTPMTAILGFVDLLADPGQSDADRRDCIRTIQRNGEHLLSILNDVLDLSKIEAGQTVVERIECSPVEVVEQVRSLMSIPAAEKGVDLKVSYDLPVPASIVTDPLRLRQVLLNLVGNGLKFTDSGAVTLAVSLVGRAHAAPSLRFTVSDTGIGMSQEQLGRIFRPFSQVDASTRRRYGGTGLGLVISKYLAEMLGGDISATSEPGRGSVFTVDIDPGPLDAAGLVNSDEELRRLLGDPEAPTPAFGPEPVSIAAPTRLLLAEDGPDNQRLISLLLTRAGFQVDIACDGRAAVEAVEAADASENPYDAVLMDMQMPEVDGYEATRTLRESGFDRPIIALTAHAMSEDRQRCCDAGCDDYLTKPVDRRLLIETVRRWTAQSGERRRAA